PTAEETARVLGADAGLPPVTAAAAVATTAVVAASTPATISGPPAAFAIGSAPLPHPPTMIDYHDQAAAPGPPTRTRGRPLVVGLVATVVILALALTVVSLALLSRRPATDAGGQAAPPPSAGTATPSAPASANSPTPI